MFRKDVILKMGAIEREYRAAALAVGELLERSFNDPTLLHSASIVGADVRACRDNSEITYIVRMFAVFAESLREVRRIVYGRDTPIKAYDLVRQCAARQHIPDDHIANAHAVREYRNSIVHGGEAPTVTVAQARKWLCTFFGRMPAWW